MIFLKELIEDGDTFKMYHGGKRWSRTPTELLPHVKGRYECGVGIYFTNNYYTARKYAKGGRVVQLVSISKNFKNIDDVKINLDDVTKFIKNLNGLRHKKEILDDIIAYSTRLNINYIYANILNNLIVNYEAGSGNVGVQISNYFVSKGADASVDEQKNNEIWLVVFNPKIIKSIEVVDSNSINNDNEILPFQNFN